jgi:hypothetical protein
MSAVMMCGALVTLLMATAAATPAAGPDMARPRGRRRASPTVMEPPPECTRSSGLWSPGCLSSSSSSSMPANAPETYAFRTANVVRSYSRMAGCRTAPETTGRSG